LEIQDEIVYDYNAYSDEEFDWVVEDSDEDSETESEEESLEDE